MSESTAKVFFALMVGLPALTLVVLWIAGISFFVAVFVAGWLGFVIMMVLKLVMEIVEGTEKLQR